MGNSIDPSSPSEVKASESCDELRKRGEQWGVQVLSSSKPRILLYHNFLSKEECEHIIALGSPNMQRSMVIDVKTGQRKYCSSRTSNGAALWREQDEIVRAIEGRIAQVTSIPIEHGSGINVLHYQVGQTLRLHHDYTLHESHLKNGGQRKATFLMYLSDVEQGGETVFPNARTNIRPYAFGCEGIVVKPKMGNALLFWNMLPDATAVDPTSLHGGRPVIKGNKWAALKLMHVRHFEQCREVQKIA